MTKVVHLQTHLPSSGNAAFRLHRALLERGVDSSILSLTSDRSLNARIGQLRMRSKLKAILNDKLHTYITRKSLERYGLFSFPILGNDVSKHKLVEEADIIYIHWALAGFLNFKNMGQLAKLDKPIIFFMHDMWNITGGCHYSFDCENFKTGCQACQMFPKKNLFELSVLEFNKKLQFYKSYDNMYFVAPSSWLFELAKKSKLTKDKPIYHIPNIVDGTIYKPMNKKEARRILNLNSDDTIITFGAMSPKSPYKGWGYLRMALEILSKEDKIKSISVVIFGCDHDEGIAKTIPFPTYFLGRLRDNHSTVLAYNAADIFVAPSLAESFGLVILEALRCSLPVVAFNTGGIPDLIDHKKNGYLAKYEDSEDLAYGITYCLENKIKGYALSLFDTDDIVDTHKALYEKIT